MTELFIGVVSHQTTRFPASQGPQGLAARLAAALSDLGTSSEVFVETADLLDPDYPLSPATVQASLTAQVRLSRSWDAYVSGGRRPARAVAEQALRRAQRVRYCLQPPPPRSMRRLLNIELAHISLLTRGVNAQAPWVLILEDDAETADTLDCSAGLAALLRQDVRPPDMVNLSESFATGRLGIASILHPHPTLQWTGTAQRSILVADRPVTNTVCAVLYAASFARRLLARFAGIPLEPVLPIDWKLNLALMQMVDAGEIGEGDCWFVTPGPIDQLSMTVG